MNVNKATGPDGIPVRILKEFANELCVCPILTKIFFNPYKQGKYPNAWKSAMVQPVLKRGRDKTDPSNYRPISIVSAIVSPKSLRNALINILSNILKLIK